MIVSRFFEAVVRWQRQHGRHDLPWQGSTDPYRVWLSEIMLQQTQVGTVLGYYDRFLRRFPDVQALASAPLQDVLALWSGLGYYSRARHLHRCAQTVVQRWGGQFPQCAKDLQSLPGIGSSTAAAIAAFCYGERVSILDGNVQRVLTRLLAFEGDLAQSANAKALWQQAQALVPADATHLQMRAYTQGLMDLGALVCKRSRPACGRCPAQSSCMAHARQQEGDFPVKTRQLRRRTERWWLQVVRRAEDGAYWLQPRPAQGIWAGLHAFAVLDEGEAAAQPPAGASGAEGPLWHDPIRHSLTHRDLVLQPVEWRVAAYAPEGPGCWVRSVAELDLGLPAPLRAWLMQRLASAAP